MYVKKSMVLLSWSRFIISYMNDELLKQAYSSDYFEELLARILF